MRIEVEIPENQLEAIAEAVAAKLRGGQTGEVLTVSQASQRAQVGPETIRRWVRAGRLARVPGLRSIRIPAESLERILKG